MALLYVALAFCAGIAAGQAPAAAGRIGCGAPGWLWLLPALLVPAAPLLHRFERPSRAPLLWPAEAGFRAPRTRPSPALVAACALAFGAGLLRLAGEPLFPCTTPADLAHHNQPAARAFDGDAPRVTVYGFVQSYVAATPGRQRVTVRAQVLDAGPGVGARDVTGDLTLLVDDPGELTYGLPVRVRGILATPPVFPDFDYHAWLARHGIHSQMTLARAAPLPGPLQGDRLRRALYGVRHRGERLIQRALPEPYAALAAGILLGIDATIPDDVQQAFNDTSATHVLVISGSNVALLTGVLLALGARLLGKRLGVAAALVGIALYALLVGGEPSVVRAAVMGTLVVLATGLGRASTALVALGAAALGMAAANPHVLWDVGFQLSVAATAGLLLIAPGLTRAISRLLGAGSSDPLLRRGAAFLADGLAVTLAASLAVLPLLLYSFQRISLVGLLTNLLIVPVQPLVLLAGTGALAVGLVGLLPLAQGLFWTAWLGLAWTLAVVERSAALRWASLALGGFGLPALLLCYGLLGLLLWQGRPKPEWMQRTRPQAARWQRRLAAPATTGVLAVAAALLWLGLRSLPDGRLHVYVLPAEHGAALFVQSPTGRQLLIDGGRDPAQTLTELGTLMPFWDRSLDLLVLTAPDARTAAAQRALPGRMQVAHALRAEGADESYDAWDRGLVAAGVPVTVTAAGGWVEIGDGAALWTLAPAASAARGGRDAAPLALRLVYGNFALLLPGETLPDSPLLEGAGFGASVLVLPADAKDALALYAAAAPALTVAYGDATLPLEGTLLYPATAGRVHLWTDGTRLWVEGER